jgi:regulator of sirC expression with transglutaminase-like and TPR domain
VADANYEVDAHNDMYIVANDQEIFDEKDLECEDKLMERLCKKQQSSSRISELRTQNDQTMNSID